MQLPIELYAFIFKFLGMKDLVRSRRVSKLWKCEIDRIGIRELVITSTITPSNRWKLTGNPVNPGSIMRLDIFNSGYDYFRTRLTNVQLLSGLKRLKIASDANLDGEPFYIYLTKFRSLEELEIEYQLDETPTICHPNLKSLYIEHVDEELDENSVEIDCPRLEKLKYSGYFFSVYLTYPETIVHLSSDFLCFDNEEFDLKPFKSLAYLSQEVSRDSSSDIFTIPSIELSQHPALKMYSFTNHYLNEEDYDFVKGRLTALIEQRERLRRWDLAIYFNGTLITSAAQLNKLFVRQYEIMDDEEEIVDDEEMDEEEIDEEEFDEEEIDEEEFDEEEITDDDDDIIQID